MDSIFNNPKTSWMGVAGAFGGALVAWSHGQLDAGSIGAVILSVSTLIMGLTAKDATTHSTPEQVREAGAKQ